MGTTTFYLRPLGGRLIRLEDALKILNNKYYNKYKGKTTNKCEWTLLKRLILNQVKHLDKEFKKSVRNKLK